MGHFILQMMVVIEMICINILTTEKCCILKNQSHLQLLLWYWSFLVIFSVLLLIQVFGIYGNGNGLGVLFGFLYLIPFTWLFEESLDHILTVV